MTAHSSSWFAQAKRVSAPGLVLFRQARLKPLRSDQSLVAFSMCFCGKREIERGHFILEAVSRSRSSSHESPPHSRLFLCRDVAIEKCWCHLVGSSSVQRSAGQGSTRSYLADADACMSKKESFASSDGAQSAKLEPVSYWIDAF